MILCYNPLYCITFKYLITDVNMRELGNMYKALVIGVIVLFIGVGIQPAIAVTLNSADSEDDCNLCPKKVSKQHIIKLKSLISRLDTLNTKLLTVSKLNPDIEERYQDISDKVAILKDINKQYLKNDGWPFPFILIFTLKL